MTDILSIGKSGLGASKKSMEVAGHNVANANTEGYSRQRVKQTTGVPITKDGLVMGSGARVHGVERIDAKHIEQRLVEAVTGHEYNRERLDQLEQIEIIFNETESEGLNKIINKFFNSFRELANQPENETMRSVVRDNAKLIIKDFNRIRSTLDDQARGVDKRLEREIVNINQISYHLADLNKKISNLEALGGESGDLRDQRDVALKSLAEYFEVSTYHDNKNNFIVNAEGVGTIVCATEVQELAVRGQPAETSSNGMSGAVEIYFKNRPSGFISEKFANGKLASLLKVRNEDLRKMQTDIDQIAYTLTKGVNAIHSRGFIYKPGISIEGENAHEFTNINFFKDVSSSENAASEMSLSDEVRNDLANIATALAPNAPGDNRVALAISKLENAKIMCNETATIEEQYLKSIGNVGVQTGKARVDTEQSEGLLAQTRAIKERITGVSLDEEAANMIKFQHAYEASARVLKAADEMFQTVLGIKR
ncbi:MAG: flagellar hook-associated protein FlgK [Bdellovibrio sp.]|nr:flagellar hook-associated protein FlgK [Bdellovibrio sp.]